MIKKYNKLVRDNTPSIISSKGEQPKYRLLSDGEFVQYLFQKLVEEAEEVEHVRDDVEQLHQELADIYEVLDAISRLKNIDMSEVERDRAEKREKVGGFEKKILLLEVAS